MDHNTRSTTWIRPSPTILSTHFENPPAHREQQSTPPPQSLPTTPILSVSPSQSPLPIIPAAATATAAPVIVGPYISDRNRLTLTPTATAVALPEINVKSYTAVAVVAEVGYNTNTIAVTAVGATATEALAVNASSSASSSRVEGTALFRDNDVLQALGKSITILLSNSIWLSHRRYILSLSFCRIAAKEIAPLRVPDKDRPGCLKCNTKFTAFPPFQKRHHCRSCGDIFCQKCSTLKIALTLPGEDYTKGPVRICDFCAIHLSIGDQNSMLRYCTILRGSRADCNTVSRLQAARALHMSTEHLRIPQVGRWYCLLCFKLLYLCTAGVRCKIRFVLLQS